MAVPVPVEMEIIIKDSGQSSSRQSDTSAILDQSLSTDNLHQAVANESLE